MEMDTDTRADLLPAFLPGHLLIPGFKQQCHRFYVAKIGRG